MIGPRVLHTIILLLLLFSALPGSATPIIASEDELRQSVTALDRARHRAVHDLAGKKQASTLDEREQRDYEKFIMYLTERIGAYCHQLTTEHGASSVSGLPCPSGNQALFEGQAGYEPTSREQIAELEKLLGESLGQFDEELLQEEERIATRQPRNRETGYGYGSNGDRGAGGGDMGTGETAGQGSGSSQTSGTEGMPGQGSEKDGTAGAQTGKEPGGSASGSGQGASGGSGEGAGPAAGAGEQQTPGTGSEPGRRELETGYDDIVARQLREAAEKETDPELKKKLWEEYYKYKEGVR
jgi:hypothetical protein